MKTFFLVTALVVAVLAKKIDVKLMQQQLTPEQSARQLLEFQKDITRLFRNINQHDYYADQEEIAVHYDIEDNIDNYNDPQAVREFWDLNRLGFLPKDEVFSIFNDWHRREAIALFKILYGARDFVTLYKTACWARIFMNERLFVYALSVALVHRPDTATIELPVIYEVHPEFFYKTDVIQQAQIARRSYRNRVDEERQNVPFGVYKNTMDEEKQMTPVNIPLRTDYRQPTTEFVNIRSRRTVLDQPRGLYDDLVSPPWYNLLPEHLRLYPQSILEALREERMRQEKLRQEQVTQDQFQPLVPERVRQTSENDQFLPERLRPEQVGVEQLRPRIDDDLRERQQNRMDFNKFEGITIDANYSTPITEADRELIMSYFTEDVGLNAYYYYYNIYFPCWLPNKMINFRTDRRGVQFYYMIRQLLARYYLERLSNDLGRTRVLDYSTQILTGYNPQMTYLNGWKFPVRPNNLWLRVARAIENTRIDNNYTNSYMFVKDYERRIRDAIDLGYVITSTGKQIFLYDENGLEMLGNLIEGNVESPNARFYGCLQIFARLFLGNAQPMRVQGEYQIPPSVLEHFETSLRDPVFFQFFKRMVMYFQRYLNNIPRYTTKDLLMPGVKVQDIKVSPLMTYFENYYVDISNAVYNKEVDRKMERVPVRVRQLRLNNKPFTFTIDINSDKSYNALIKVFLGPKQDHMGRRLDITENYLDFVEIDKFPAVLMPGMNNIRRSSLENFYCRDRTTYRQLYARIMMNINNPGPIEYEPREPEWSWPRRLLLPKGKENGQLYQLYVIVMPYTVTKDKYSKGMDQPVVNWRRIVDNRPLGYPLDRPIDENVFHVPNSLFKDVVITHMGRKTDI